MDTGLQVAVGKWGINVESFLFCIALCNNLFGLHYCNPLGYDFGFNNCRVFYSQMVFYVSTCRGQKWVTIIGAMVQIAINIKHRTGYEVLKAQRFWGPERLPRIIGTRIIVGPTFVVKVVGTILCMHIGTSLLDYTQGPSHLKHRLKLMLWLGLFGMVKHIKQKI